MHGHTPGEAPTLSLCCYSFALRKQSFGKQKSISVSGAGADSPYRLLGHRARNVDAVSLSGRGRPDGINDYCVPAESLENAVQISWATNSQATARAGRSQAVISNASERYANSGKKKAEEFLQLFSSEDQKEGMKAFLEKREAKFLGR